MEKQSTKLTQGHKYWQVVIESAEVVARVVRIFVVHFDAMTVQPASHFACNRDWDVLVFALRITIAKSRYTEAKTHVCTRSTAPDVLFSQGSAYNITGFFSLQVVSITGILGISHILPLEKKMKKKITVHISITRFACAPTRMPCLLQFFVP